MDDEVLRRLARSLRPEELSEVRSGRVRNEWVEDIERNGEPISVEPLLALMADFADRTARGDLSSLDPPATDRWLAPRLHWALRLSRAEASDRDLWAYLANFHLADSYVAWRWGKGEILKVNESRWRGPVHKQALARLWWSAELFRNGPDYSPVEQLLVNQDFPNSYVHRTFSRSRPMAIGLLDAVNAAVGGATPTSDEINDVARRVNLTLGATSLDTVTGFHRDDTATYRAWLQESTPSDVDWSVLPAGPPDGGVNINWRARAEVVGAHICESAGLTVAD